MKKRILATLLALVMALGLCVTTAWADETVHELRQIDINNGTYWQPNGESDVNEYYLKGGSYKLMENIVLESALWVDEDSTGGVTIDLNGYTLSLKSGIYNNVLYVYNVTLTLTDSSAGKTGKITGGTGDKHDGNCVGGGVWVHHNGTFKMYGGIITGCSANLGGGVFVEDNSSFEMYGGTITGCTAKQGGAVYLDDSVMHANGGTVNGPVYVEEDSGITVSDEYANLYDKQTVFLDTVTTVKGPSGGVYKKALVKEGSDKKWIFGGLYWVDPIDRENFDMESVFHTATYMNGNDEYAKAFAIVYNEDDFGKSCTFAEPDTPVREGYTFLGWYYLNDDGSEVKWDFANDKAEITETLQVGSSHTFYAHWEQLPAKNDDEPTTAPAHESIRRQSTTTTTTDTTTDTTKTDVVTSAKTFDAGVAVYGAMAVASLLCMGYVGKKRV